MGVLIRKKHLSSLRSSSEFSAVFQARRLSKPRPEARFFDVFFISGQSDLALGLAVSAKAAPTSVLRNLIKRQVRHGCYDFFSVLSSSDALGLHLVFRAKHYVKQAYADAKKAKELTSFCHQLRAEIRRHLEAVVQPAQHHR